MKSLIPSIKWTLFTAFFRRGFSILIFLFILKFVSPDIVGTFREFSTIVFIPPMIALFSLEYLFIVEKKNKRKIFFSLTQLGILSGLFFSVILFFLAKPIANFYHNQELLKIIKFGSIVIFLEILRKIFKYSIQNRLKFHALANYETINVVFYSIIIFLFIKRYPSAFFLTAVFYLGDFLETILLFFDGLHYNFLPFMESLKFKNISLTKQIIKNEKKFLTLNTLSNLTSYLAGTIPVFIFGRYFSSSFVGLYYMANQIVAIPVHLITNSLQQIFFPSFSKLSKQLIREKVFRYGNFVVSTLWILFAFYIFWGIKLIPLIVNPEWQKAVSVMLIISFYIATTLFISPISSIPIIFKRPDLELYWNVLSFILNLIAILFGAKFGFYQALIFFSASTVLNHFFFLLIILHLIEADSLDYLKSLLKQFLPGILFYLSLFYVSRFTLIFSLISSLLLLLLYFIIINSISKGRFLKEMKVILRIN